MKKILFFLLFSILKYSHAQITEGSIAPDFTFNDINGNPQHLYTYLNANKFVFLDVSATWCSPCWFLHDSIHLLDQVYNQFDTPGDQTGKVLFVEADANTNMADLQGTGTTTLGDWVTGSNYSIMNPDSLPLPGESSLPVFLSQYQPFGLPFLVMICPNKTVWFDTLNNPGKTTPWPPSLATIQWIANTKCNFPSSIDMIDSHHSLSIYPNPTQQNMQVLFSLQKSATVSLEVYTMLGQMLVKQPYGSLQPGDQQIILNTQSLARGVYIMRLSVNNRVISKRFSKL